jgi:hypothetical protein
MAQSGSDCRDEDSVLIVKLRTQSSVLIVNSFCVVGTPTTKLRGTKDKGQLCSDCRNEEGI